MSPPLPAPSTFDPPSSTSPPSTSTTPSATTGPYPPPPCPFCNISSLYPPYPPSSPPSPPYPSISPHPTSLSPPTYLILSTPLLISFLDIMPLSPGHILLCPRRHAPKLTDITPSEAREMGYYLRVLSAAVARATGTKDWNVVQNNGAAAAQVVPHMHFHVIPRPELRNRGRERFTSTMFGRGQREDLDDEEGEELAERIRRAVVEVLKEEEGGRGKL